MKLRRSMPGLVEALEPRLLLSADFARGTWTRNGVRNLFCCSMAPGVRMSNAKGS
jgi:hypothetical protein